jgi:pyrroline-5-carboxylate reductase
MEDVLNEIGSTVKSSQTVVSTVTGYDLENLKKKLKTNPAVIRAMPNTAISIRESMTCLAADEDISKKKLETVKNLFDQLGKTLIIHEELMGAATALCACGIAFFLRAIRAASQGGVQVGFHAEEAVLMAAQTARGAASLVVHTDTQPETEVDKVTTPEGCTIVGLNQMEHSGFSSAMIKGIVLSTDKANHLIKNDNKESRN